jgi:ribosomal-protein-alanine N-acetyltransferase
MMTIEPQQSLTAADLAVRTAVSADHQRIADLIFFESHVHRHLDWRAPLDWLGHSPYWVIEEDGRLTGALACPPDPESIAWIRLFAFASDRSGPSAWSLLWNAAHPQLAQGGGATVAAIAIQRWFDPILIGAGFDLAGDIVLLEWEHQAAPRAAVPSGVAIRAMTFEDLPGVLEVDAAAFEPLWRNSLEALSKAYAQASYASVAHDRSGLIGYQLSTAASFGTHLARLAVRPEAQRRGLGAALVSDLLAQIPRGSESRVTVNTQANNAASLALYQRLGFRRTGERYPVYQMEIRP